MTFPPVVTAVEHTVNNMCRQLRMTAEEARQIVRAEVGLDALMELRAWEGARFDIENWQAFAERREPLRLRGVSYYEVPRMEGWRVIGMGAALSGRPVSAVTNG